MTRMLCSCKAPAPSEPPRGELIVLSAEIRELNAAMADLPLEESLPVFEHAGTDYRILTVFQRCFMHGGVKLYGWRADQSLINAPERVFLDVTDAEWQAGLQRYSDRLAAERARTAQG